jgi:hypothetical protein
VPFPGAGLGPLWAGWRGFVKRALSTGAGATGPSSKGAESGAKRGRSRHDLDYGAWGRDGRVGRWPAGPANKRAGREPRHVWCRLAGSAVSLLE